VRLGTSNFVGLRLAQAREVRGWSQTDLSKVLGVKRQAVSAYEKALPENPGVGATPAPDIFFRIAHELRLPPRFFLKPVEVTPSLGALFRQKKSALERSKMRSAILADWSCEIVDVLEKYVVLPEVKLPKVVQRTDPNLITEQDIERSANELRATWGLTPEEPVTHLLARLETNGIVVVSFDFNTTDVEGFAFSHQGRPYVFLNSRLRNPSRRNTTIAHEVPHLILHSLVERDEGSLSWEGLAEVQAYHMAGCFLLPAKPFLNDVYRYRAINLDALKMLKAKWRTSIAFMIERLWKLKIIDKTHRQSLYQNASRRGWRLNEPFDDQFTLEEPSLIPKTFEAISKSGFYDIGKIIDEAAFGQEQVLDLFGLDFKQYGTAKEESNLKINPVLKFYQDDDQSLFKSE
jgi:Zn-dependent peptidase ImmA (M78 family)/transcriptional regulator with XRE-family HTH domain